MFKNAYLARVFQDVKNTNPYEGEFIQAVEEFLSAIDLIVDDNPEIEKLGIIERIVEPERTISFRVPWVDDLGRVQVNRGYRVQFNSAIGPYKGGIRFDESVNQSIMKFLGFEQTFKNALTGLPMGGGKGGANFNPRGKSDHEIMRFCQSFMSELYRHIGPNTDVPAGDFGVGAREVGYLFGYYKKLNNEFTSTFTGKGLSFGGSLLRPEATGYGLLYFVEELLQHQKSETLAGKRILISGSGNVGSNAAIKARDLGAIVVGMNDISGMIYNEAGLDVDLVKKIKDQRENLVNYNLLKPDTVFSSNPKDLWKMTCDLVLPCAMQNEIDLDDAVNLVKGGVQVVCEGANMPTTIAATKYFEEHGVIIGPSKAANAGGVATSGLEMSQNAMRLSWSEEEVDEKLKMIMKDIYHNIYQASKIIGKPGNLIVGANIAGFWKVYEAMKAQGII